MTLNELIGYLVALVDRDPPLGEYTVWLEGCDCDGLAGSEVYTNDEGRTLTLNRERERGW